MHFRVAQMWLVLALFVTEISHFLNILSKWYSTHSSWVWCLTTDCFPDLKVFVISIMVIIGTVCSSLFDQERTHHVSSATLSVRGYWVKTLKIKNAEKLIYRAKTCDCVSRCYIFDFMSQSGNMAEQVVVVIFVLSHVCDKHRYTSTSSVVLA